MRRFLLFALLLAALMGLELGAEDVFSLTGRVSATDQEMQEGYFAIDNEAMLVAKPGTPLHAYLKARVGDRVRITVEPAGASRDSD